MLAWRSAVESISSRQNPLVRVFRELVAAPDSTGARLLVDGAHLLREALESSAAIEVAAIAASRADGAGEVSELMNTIERSGGRVVRVTEPVMRALSPVRAPAGVVGIVRRRPSAAADILRDAAALVLVVVDVQDPGNVGSLIRSAEAAGASGALVCGMSASPFSWKAVRGSMGSVLRLPVIHGWTPETALTCLAEAGFTTAAAVARGGLAPDEVDWTGRKAVLLGGEGSGLDAAIIADCDLRVTLPMSGPVESLNVAAAGAVILYAARRQRL